MCADVLQVDISDQNTLSDEVIMHFDVLGPKMEDWVLSNMNTTNVVAVEKNWIFDGNAQILKYPFQPNGLTRGDCRAPVFRFCDRQCDCRLLFAAPGYSSAVEGEEEPRG